jgi:hypothetical protein
MDRLNLATRVLAQDAQSIPNETRALNAAQALRNTAPSPELDAALERFQTVIELRQALRSAPPGGTTRGDDQAQRDLSKLETDTAQQLQGAAKTLPSRYSQPSFKCIEDGQNCSETSVPAFACAIALVVCLAERLVPLRK